MVPTMLQIIDTAITLVFYTIIAVAAVLVLGAFFWIIDTIKRFHHWLRGKRYRSIFVHLHATANVTGGGKPPITAPSLAPSVAERASSPKAPLRMRRTPLHFGRKVLVPRRRSCPRNVCVRWHLAAADLLASLERK
jgi:hypothetical protein